MGEGLRHLLEQSPMLALFGVIGIGYAIGQISIGGFSLGIGAVLFAGLAVGALAPQSAPPGFVSSIGLVMFLYGIGIQYGRQFFAGLTGPGLKWNLLAGASILAAFGLTLFLGRLAGVSMAYSMGLFAGALTSTPTLQAAIDAAGNRDPAIGYSVAYPFGVIGPILCLFAFSRLLRPRLAPAPAPLQHVELTLEHPPGPTLREVLAALPTGVELVALRQGHSNALPDDVTAPVAAGDTLLLLGNPEALEVARSTLGREASGQIVRDRSQLDIVRAYVSRPAIVGVRIGDLTFPRGVEARIAEVRRGDLLLLPRPDLVLEWGDRVGVIASRDSLAGVRRLFGDSIKSTTEFSYVSVGLGMSLGVLLGLLAIPLPGLGSFSLGLAGGPLVVALILGRLGRVGSFSWHIPLAANLTLRNFGLTLFLAAVGLDSGAPFVETVSRTGFTLLAIGMAIVLAATAGILLAGHLAGTAATDDLFGIASGAAGNPAILVHANRTLSSDRIDVAYATIFPSMTILKILCVQVGIGVLPGG
jgi:putative transport protein